MGSASPVAGQRKTWRWELQPAGRAEVAGQLQVAAILVHRRCQQAVEAPQQRPHEGPLQGGGGWEGGGWGLAVVV